MNETMEILDKLIPLMQGAGEGMFTLALMVVLKPFLLSALWASVLLLVLMRGAKLIQTCSEPEDWTVHEEIREALGLVGAGELTHSERVTVARMIRDMRS